MIGPHACGSSSAGVRSAGAFVIDEAADRYFASFEAVSGGFRGRLVGVVLVGVVLVGVVLVRTPPLGGACARADPPPNARDAVPITRAHASVTMTVRAGRTALNALAPSTLPEVVIRKIPPGERFYSAVSP